MRYKNNPRLQNAPRLTLELINLGALFVDICIYSCSVWEIVKKEILQLKWLAVEDICDQNVPLY